LISQSFNDAALWIVLQADAGKDAGYEWKLNIADEVIITFGNDIASHGTYENILLLL
jgi:hypothetical protein